MSSVVRTSVYDHLLRGTRFARWTLILWSVFVTAVVSGPTFTWDLDYLELSWCFSAVIGITAGVLGLWRRQHWIILALLASVLLVAATAIHWSTLMDKVLLHEEQKSVASFIRRILEGEWMAMQGAIATRTVIFPIWWLAAFYREMLMPLLQFVLLLIFGGAWAARRTDAQPIP